MSNASHSSPVATDAPASPAPETKPEAFWKTWSATDKALALLPAALAGIVVYDQWYLWSTKEDYAFGYAVPFFSAYVIYDRWPKSRRISPVRQRPAKRPRRVG